LDATNPLGDMEKFKRTRAPPDVLERVEGMLARGGRRCDPGVFLVDFGFEMKGGGGRSDLLEHLCATK